MARTDIQRFRREVWNYYKRNGRNTLPWRKTTDPYKILVSEVMLQQTQVPRVIEKYKSFIKKFPTVRKLADARLSKVLKEWSGLGYNRRGKYLHDAAMIVTKEFGGDMKKALKHPLPGVGAYTRAAVGTFAFNEPNQMIETNIRTVYIQHFFPPSGKMKRGGPLLHDAAILQIAAQAAKGQDPRTWHWALMDYGSYLKRTGVRNNIRSKHYTKQSKFEGSLRQIRGEILRQLHKGPASRSVIHRNLARTLLGSHEARGALAVQEKNLTGALAGLERDGLIKLAKGSARGGSVSGRKWRIA
jgi:A/G-specific adenine glycosylase